MESCENKIKNHNRGYCRVGFNGIKVCYHVNYLWILSTGKDIPQGMEIDHIMGIKLIIELKILDLLQIGKTSKTKKIKKHRAGIDLGAIYVNISLLAITD